MKQVEILLEDGIIQEINLDEGVKLVLLDVDFSTEDDAPVIEKHYIRGDDGTDKCIYRDEREVI